MIYYCDNKECENFKKEVFVSKVAYRYDLFTGLCHSNVECPICNREYRYEKRHTGYTKNIPKQGKV